MSKTSFDPEIQCLSALDPKYIENIEGNLRKILLAIDISTEYHAVWLNN